jgi:hypothetical protein
MPARPAELGPPPPAGVGSGGRPSGARGKYVGMAVVVAGLLAGCTAVSPAPPRWKRSTEEATRTPWGTWAHLTLSTGPVVAGELLAIDDKTAYLGLASGLHVVPVPCVATMKLAIYEADPFGAGLAGVLGTLSTVSHGLVLIASAPAWLLTTAVATFSLSSVGHQNVGPGQTPPNHARKFARFPTGLPPGYRASAKLASTFDGRCLASTPAPSPPPPAPPGPTTAPTPPAPTTPTPVPSTAATPPAPTASPPRAPSTTSSTGRDAGETP